MGWSGALFKRGTVHAIWRPCCRAAGAWGRGSNHPALAVPSAVDRKVLAGLSCPAHPSPPLHGRGGKHITAAAYSGLSPLRARRCGSRAALEGRVGYCQGRASPDARWGWDARAGASRLGLPRAAAFQRSLPFGLGCST